MKAGPDVSVVLVHGMGTQRPGETVTEWVESVLRFTDLQDRRAGPTDVTPLPDAGGPGDGDAAEPPASALLEIGAPGTRPDVVVESPVVRLRMVEAHWADAFEAPAPADVLRWLLWFAPSFTLTQMVLEVRAARAARTTDGGRAALSLLRPFAPVYSIALGLVLLALAGPVLLVAVLVLVLTSAIPSRRVRDLAAGALAMLSQDVGDVQSFLIRPVARARMEARIAEVVVAEVVRHGRERVHVLATSQGAALSHAVLLRLPPELRPARLTTVGGAHGRLNDMRLLTPPSWTRVPIVLTGLAWLAALPLVGALGLPAGLAVVLGTTLASLVALGVAAAKGVSALSAHATSADRGWPAPGAVLPTPGTVPGVEWLDLWAPFDLVPNGRPVVPAGRAPLPDRADQLGEVPGPGAYRAVLVPGEMRVVGDHISYRDDWPESVPRILHHLTSGLPPSARLGAPRGVRARSPLVDPDGTGPNWTPWARRDWVALVLRSLPALAALTVLLTPGRESYRALGGVLTGLHPSLVTLADGADRAVDRALSLAGPSAVSAAGTLDLVAGTVLVLGLALAVGGTAGALFRAAARAESATWVRSLTTTAPRRWSTGRWVAVGSAIVGVWTAAAGGSLAILRAVSP